MKLKSVAALALAACAALLAPAQVQSAEAGEVLDRLRSHGLGKWVDKYVDEDKSGKVRYKRASEDKWSKDYYDSTTGTWTGKHFNGEHDASEVTKTAKKKPVALSSKKSSTTLRTAGSTHSYKKKKLKDLASESVPVAPAAAAEPIEPELPSKDVKSPELTPESPLSKPTVQGALAAPAMVASVPELYGPPVPDALSAAVY